MASPRVLPGLFVPVAFQTASLANSTAVAVNSTVRAAKPSRLVVSVETQSVRFRDDGTNPTLTTGVLLTAANSPYVFEGYNRTSALKFQRSTGTAKISIAAYKNFGD